MRGTDGIAREFRFTFRSVRRAPLFFATAVVILGVGIGMSVAMFTVFRTVLVRQLPVVDQDRVVVMWTYVADPKTDVVTGTEDLSVVRRQSRTMRGIAAVAHWPATPSPFAYGERSVELNRGMVTGNFFDVLGVRPALGRLFRPSDDEPPNAKATDSRVIRNLVLSYRSWRQQFGGDSSVVGRHLIDPLVGIDYTIIGVAPLGFDYPAGVGYWIPMWNGWSSRVSAFAVARLAPGATVTTARDEYLAIERRLEPKLTLRGAHAATFAETVLGNVRPVLMVLTGAVALLLLITCLNVGNLLLLHASSRTREIAVRRALGATFLDIIRLSFLESLAIAVTGGILGLGVAIALLRLLIAFAPPTLPRLNEVQLAGAPIGIAAAVVAIAVLLFGIAPAVLTARGKIASPLRFDARTGIETTRRRGLRQLLVASQIALATVMLGGAALLARSLAQLEGQDTGFVSEHLINVWYSWNARRDTTLTSMVELADRLTRRVRAIPGVTAVTPLVAPPMVGNGIWQIRFEVEDQPVVDAASNPMFPTEMIGPEFFTTFGVRVVRGRAFTDGDGRTDPLVAIVSESIARRLWPGENPIGKRIRIPGAKTEDIGGGDGWRTIVGVAHDTHLRTLREATPMVFFPSLQGYWQGDIAIRSRLPLGALLPALRAAGREVDPDLALWSPQTMDEILDGPLAQPRLGALLMSSFGAVALLLAAIGLFGVMSSLVRDQTREFGIRIALGATPSVVRRSVLRRAGAVAGVGAAIGLVATLLLSRLLASLLFHVRPTDAVALGGACVVLLATAAVAAYVPAHRATTIDPVQALRAD